MLFHDMKQQTETAKGFVQSIERAFDILELLSQNSRGFTLTEISTALNLHKSTVHRILGGLLHRKYVEKDPLSNSYRIGLGFVHMSGMYLNRIELKTEAEYYMRELANTLGQVVFLAIRANNEVVYIDKIEQFDSMHRFAIIGQRRPFYCTAIGKALLFNENDHSLKEIFENEDRQKRTPTAATEIPELIDQIKRFRAQGFSVDNEEWELGTKCAGAPIYDYRNKIVAALSTAWNCQQKDNDLNNVGKLVRETALKISVRLGYFKESIENTEFLI